MSKTLKEEERLSMTKRVLVLMDVPEEQTVDGTKFAVEQAFGKDVTVHEVSYYPLDKNTLQPHFLDIYDDADAFLNIGNGISLSEEQLRQVTEVVGEEEANNGEFRNNRIIAAANELGYLPGEE
jgi:enoyl-[acyl-carrier-protein] reductase (NADH)